MTTHHLPSATGAPLCGRVLSRNTPLTQRDQGTMLIASLDPANGFAPEQQTRSKPCRHCLRVAGLIPSLTKEGKELQAAFILAQAEYEEEMLDVGEE